MTIVPSLMTADELLTYEDLGGRTELIRGRLVVREPMGGTHAGVLVQLTLALELHVRRTQPPAGRVLVGDPGFLIARDPDTVRAPDLAFISRERLSNGAIANGYQPGVPDLAVEIRSPSDRAGALLQKIGEWLDGGTTLVWVVDPQRRVAQQYAADGTVRLLRDGDALEGEPVLPGLRVPLPSLWLDAL